MPICYVRLKATSCATVHHLLMGSTSGRGPNKKADVWGMKEDTASAYRLMIKVS